MKIAGIIAEYNPFHNGHKYHIEKTRQLTKADGIVAVMSGNFVQRGDGSVCDKWTRAEAAIVGGCDLVIELPIYYSVSVAQLFAFGGVSILNSLGCVDYISFGCEENTLFPLIQIADAICKNSTAIDEKIKKHITSQIPYPIARAKAIANICKSDESIISSPNNMLSIEYLCALKKLNSRIEPVAVKREGNAYHDTDITSHLASSSAIREALKNNLDFSNAVPGEVYRVYKRAENEGLFPIFTHNFDAMLLSNLRSKKPEDLAKIIDMPEGFENRICSMSKKATTIDELVDLCSAKQYTRARIRRLLVASFLGIENMGYDKVPTYARVLAANSIGTAMLSCMKNSASIPIITKAADYAEKETDPLFLLDVLASDMYSLAYEKPRLRQGGSDFKTSPIILR